MKTTYYIESGALKEAVQAETPMEAAKSAFMRALEKELILGLITSCSIHGFRPADTDSDDIPNDDLFISTKQILIETGLIDKYSIQDLTIDE